MLVGAIGLEENKTQRLAKKHGRTLSKHALMYILKGHGYFEDTETLRTPVTPGTVFYLHPNRWHNFDPAPGTAWTEYWVIFDGPSSMKKFGNLIPKKPSIFPIGIDEELNNHYEELYDLWSYGSKYAEEYSNYLLHCILMSVYKNIHQISLLRNDGMITRVRHKMIRELHEEEFDFRDVANREGVTYDFLRKRFKEETGIAPHHYFLMLKVNRAREMLLRSGLTIKEISYQLGFADPYYFSRLFKQKTGISPGQYRKDNVRYE